MDKRTYFHRVAASNSATISKKSSNSAEKKYHYKRNYISITRYLFTILIIGIALALTAFRPTYTPSPSYYEPCKIENKTFQGGEIAVYKLYYNLQFVWIPAGEVVFTVKDLGNQYYISARGYTYPSYEWFYKVRDHYESYIDKSTLLPTQAIRTVQEGNYRHYEEVQFNQLAKSVAYIEGKTKDNLRKDTTFELGNCTHDILSLLYFSRNLQFTHLTKGTSFPLTFFMDEKTYPIGVQFEGKEPNKKIKGLGRF